MNEILADVMLLMLFFLSGFNLMLALLNFVARQWRVALVPLAGGLLCGFVGVVRCLTLYS